MNGAINAHGAITDLEHEEHEDKDKGDLDHHHHKLCHHMSQHHLQASHPRYPRSGNGLYFLFETVFV